MDERPTREDRAPYRRPWELSAARAYFARSPMPLSESVAAQRVDRSLTWREMRYTVEAGVEAIATLITPRSSGITRGVVLAHGGSDDGRRFFVSEAAALASRGAAVILPAIRVRLDEGVDAFASDVRTAILTERAALDVLLAAGAPPDGLCFLGHSAGGAYAAVLCAVEPRLAAIVIFANGVACHRDGTTRTGFLPGSWDHCSASYGTTRRVLTPGVLGRLFDLPVLSQGMEVADDGVPGGRCG